MDHKTMSILRRVVIVMESATRECPNVGISCDIWEHDVDCACLREAVEELIEGAAK